MRESPGYSTTSQWLQYIFFSVNLLASFRHFLKNQSKITANKNPDMCPIADLIELTTTKKDVLITIGEENANLGRQEIPGVTGKFGLVVKNEAGQKLT